MILENQLLLANVAFEGENYQESYNMYSSVLENDIANSEAWIKKGLSSGYLSTNDKERLTETTKCIEQAKKNGINNELNILISKHIIKISRHYISELIKEAKNASENNSMKPMATGELYIAKQFKNSVGRLVANNNIFDRVHNAIIFSLIASNHSSEVNIIKEQVDLIDKFFSDINNELHKDKSPILITEREQLIYKIKLRDPSYIVKETPKSEGCFIATHLYNDYDNPKVLVLRRFRDSFLSRSDLGNLLIKEYYNYSPKLVNKLRDKIVISYLIKKIIFEPAIFILKIVQFK